MNAIGALAAGIGTLIGAGLGQLLGVLIGGLLATLLYPDGGLQGVALIVVGMVLGVWPGGVAGCWLGMRLLRQPRARRAALVLAVMVPLLAPLIGLLLPAVGVVVHPLALAPMVALLGVAAYLLTARE